MIPLLMQQYLMDFRVFDYDGHSWTEVYGEQGDRCLGCSEEITRKEIAHSSKINDSVAFFFRDEFKDDTDCDVR